jgi:hypothetical protein
MAHPPAKHTKFFIENVLGFNDENASISIEVDGEEACRLSETVLTQTDQEPLPIKKPEDHIEQLSFKSRFNRIFNKVQYVSLFMIKVSNIQ